MSDVVRSEPSEPWYAARCVFSYENRDRRRVYEERIVLLRADDEAHALRLAEEDAARYAGQGEGCAFTGFVDLFHLFESEIGHGTEVFSLLRPSDRTPEEYLTAFFDTGEELRRNEG